jgi:cytochrome c oxidase cbb3-type subunit 2
MVPESVMPNYPWLLENRLDYSNVTQRMSALRMVGVPYSSNEAEYKRNVDTFGEDVANTLRIEKGEENLVKQAGMGNFDNNKSDVTEMDALVAYLQVLGTMVDFKQFDDDYFAKFR